MTIKSKGIRIDKNGRLQLDKRCKEHYWYNQPERSKREDLKECVICKNKVVNLSEKETCEVCDFKIIKQIHSRCGALNSMET